MLVLDEPGNHLDVDTVEALAEALLEYQGTVIFTSHDRHFMKRIATCIIEVRDGRVINYRGDYEAYLYAVNKEIDDGERDTQRKSLTPAQRDRKSAKVDSRAERLDDRALKKQLAKAEKTIARLDDEKRKLNEQLLTSTDPEEALRLHNTIVELSQQLAEAEEMWCQLQAEGE